MMQRIKVGVATLCLSLTVGGCSTAIKPESFDKPLLAPDEMGLRTGWRAEGTPMYLRVREDGGEQVAPLRLASVPISFVLSQALPQYQVIAMDSGVNLGRLTSIAVDSISAAQFLERLGQVSGYDYALVDRAIEVRSTITREWTLAALAGSVTSEARVQGGTGQQGGTSGANAVASSTTTSTSGGSGGSGQRQLSAEYKTEIDEWEGIVKTARSIMEARRFLGPVRNAGAIATDSTGAALTASADTGDIIDGKLVAVKSLGLIRATGSVERVRALDQWMQSLLARSEKQIRLDARFIEVSLTDSQQRGVDWSAMGQHFFESGVGLNVNLGGSYPVSNETAGLFNLGVDLAYGDESLSSVFTFLSNFGQVELRDEPQATTLNGRTVYIGSGEEFGYISRIEQTATNGAIAITPVLERVLIGVEMATTPRLTEDGSILMEIVPVVSNFRGFDQFTVAGNQFSQPRVTLKQLATQVKTRPGQPVMIGGLISTRLVSELKKLPLNERLALGFDKLFESDNNSLERKELILVITPHLQET